MNAASELRYPVTFSSEERRIYLKGEAYFQVKSDKKRPFYVETDNLCIRVLGTEFNVNTHYSKGVRTVMVGGTIVLLRKDQLEIQMTPGELADFDQKTSEIMVQKVDITPYISWKKGFFVFAEILIPELVNSLDDEKSLQDTFDQYCAGRLWEHNSYIKNVDKISNLCNVPF